MKNLLVACFAVIVFSFAVAAQDKCFRNDGLKESWIISYSLNGSAVSGTFVSESYDDPDDKKTVEFTGTKTGTKLTVNFNGKAPYETAPGTKSIVWSLVGRALKVPMYGKNYETNKYSAYTATFDQCSEQ